METEKQVQPEEEMAPVMTNTTTAGGDRKSRNRQSSSSKKKWNIIQSATRLIRYKSSGSTVRSSSRMSTNTASSASSKPAASSRMSHGKNTKESTSTRSLRSTDSASTTYEGPSVVDYEDVYTTAKRTSNLSFKFHNPAVLGADDMSEEDRALFREKGLRLHKVTKQVEDPSKIQNPRTRVHIPKLLLELDHPFDKNAQRIKEDSENGGSARSTTTEFDFISDGENDDDPNKRDLPTPKQEPQVSEIEDQEHQPFKPPVGELLSDDADLFQTKAKPQISSARKGFEDVDIETTKPDRSRIISFRKPDNTDLLKEIRMVGSLRRESITGKQDNRKSMRPLSMRVPNMQSAKEPPPPERRKLPKDDASKSLSARLRARAKR